MQTNVVNWIWMLIFLIILHIIEKRKYQDLFFFEVCVIPYNTNYILYFIILIIIFLIHSRDNITWVDQFKIYNQPSTGVLTKKGVLKIRSKFTGEHSCRSTISIKLQSNFIEIALRYGCYVVNLLYIFRTPF